MLGNLYDKGFSFVLLSLHLLCPLYDQIGEIVEKVFDINYRLYGTTIFITLKIACKFGLKLILDKWDYNIPVCQHPLPVLLTLKNTKSI